MILWTAFMLGLVGSLHCAGMCGPLLLAVPAGPLRRSLLARRLVYNSGRLVTYALIGVVFGLLGWTFVLAGWQRWISIAAGAAIVSGVLTSSRLMKAGRLQPWIGALQRTFGRLLIQRGWCAQFCLGLLNGLLPCGLVYAAAAGATAAGSALAGASYMIAFGLGTFPMMITLGVAGHRIQPAFRLRWQRLVPVSLALIGGLLILRGLALDIPYLSPVVGSACGHCHSMVQTKPAVVGKDQLSEAGK